MILPGRSLADPVSSVTPLATFIISVLIRREQSRVGLASCSS
jgi:hypothetical protein